ncbi:MAG: hypothetical protein A2Z72_08065 [Omnitrophica bacterium RBG_13_46_9]|nr:MAG: hypothetical protein A2Z72_08065 [Omnitrophica bacterium RBG_13_46_9]
MRKYSIIIASYNDAKNLADCLESLRATDCPREDFETIVVDNNSTDNTRDVVSRYPEVIYLTEDKNGRSFARNKGIRHAKGDILVFLDSDGRVTDGWLRRITEPFSDRGVGAVGGAIFPFEEGNLISQYLAVSLFLTYPRYGRKRYVRGYPSCNLAVRKRLVPQGFDTAVFNAYGGEDKDLCYQVLGLGYKIVFQPDAIIYHRHPTTLRGLVKSLIESSRGRGDFAKKYPFAPDVFLLNIHFPLLYGFVLIVSVFFRKSYVFILSLLPGLVYFLLNSIVSYKRSKRFGLSFFIKPVLDLISICAVYPSYHYFRTFGRQGRL